MAINPLVIVDSEIKGRTLQDQYSRDIDILVVESPPVKIAYRKPKADPGQERDAVVKNSFDIAPLASAKKQIAKILGVAYGEIYLAFDSDRRGEYLSWLIAELIRSATTGDEAKPPKRLHLVGLSAEEIAYAFTYCEAVNEQKALSFYVGNLFNSSLGNQLERLLGTKTGPGKLPLNFPSLTTMFMLAEREEEIRTYTPALKWQVLVHLDGGAGEFPARLEEAFGISEDGFFANPDAGKKGVDQFKDQEFLVKKITRTAFTIPPPIPYRMAELLQDAFIVYGMEPRQVLGSAFKLFYGVEIEGTLVGLISAFFSEKNSRMPELLNHLQEYMAEEFGEESLADEENDLVSYDYIIPLRPEIDADELRKFLSDADCNLYELIRGRALASQMNPAQGYTIEVLLKAGEDSKFKASGRHAENRGFLEVYQNWRDRELMQPSPLAGIREGDNVRLGKVIPEQTTGATPEYYTFESLFAELADFSIPVEPSVILLLQSLKDQQYFTITPEGSLRCGSNTAKVISTVNRAFPSMPGISLSAYIQQTLDEAATNRKPLDSAIKQFRQTMIMRGNVIAKVKIPTRIAPRMKRQSRFIIKSPEQLAAVGDTATTLPPVIAGDDQPPVETSAPVTSPIGAAIHEKQVGGEDLAEMPQVDADNGNQSFGGEPIPEAPESADEDALAMEMAGEDEISDLEETDDFSAAFAMGDPPDEAGTEEPGQEPPAAGDVELAAKAQEIFEETAEAPAVEEVAAEPVLEELVGGEARDCPKCGSPLLLKQDRFGKFWSCSGYPACRFAESYTKDSADQEMDCPLCSVGKIIAKKTPAGKTFYVCPESTCEFMAWSRPHALRCQVCNYPFLVEKLDLAGRTLLRCPRAGCSFTQPLPGDHGYLLTGDSADQTVGPGGALPDSGDPSAPRKKKIRIRRSAGGAPSSGKKKVRIVRRKK